MTEVSKREDCLKKKFELVMSGVQQVRRVYNIKCCLSQRVVYDA